MNAGAQLLQVGRAEQALPHLLRAFEIEPADTDAALNLGAVYIMLREYDQAIPILETASRAAPENSRVWINLGAAYLGDRAAANDQRRARAITAFERALEFDPAAPSVNYNLGLIYRDQGDLEVALAHFSRAAAINPFDRDADRLMRKLLQLLGRSPEDESLVTEDSDGT